MSGTGESPSTTDLVVPEPPVRPLHWSGSWRKGAVHILDQTRLPRQETVLARERSRDVVEDIQRLAVRGAPIIGVAGAYAVVLAAREVLDRHGPLDRPRFLSALAEAVVPIAEARPTAINLGTAVRRALAAANASPENPERICEALLESAHELARYEHEACAAMGLHAATWLAGRTRFVTHCNAGALVSTGIGTALSPFYVLHASGVPIHVWVDETRPLLQGLRLTAFELGRAGVPLQVVSDGASAGLIQRGEADAVVVGADRVCRNGDVANKVGTYGLALAARAAGIPFVVIAPRSTLDPEAASGADVPIEERPADTARYLDPSIVPTDLPTRAPAFDITPAGLVSALISEDGVVENPDENRLDRWISWAAALQRGARGGR